MEINLKNYNISKTQTFIQDEILLVFLNGLPLELNANISTEQKLKKLRLSGYKTHNKITKKLLKQSIYHNLLSIIQNNMFLLTTEEKMMISTVVTSNFEQLSLLFLFLKLNNKFYSKHQLKNSFIINYDKNNLTFFKFGLTNIKT